MIKTGARLTIVTEGHVITCVVKRIRVRGDTDAVPQILIENPKTEQYYPATAEQNIPLDLEDAEFVPPEDLPYQDGREIRASGVGSPLCALEDWDGRCTACAHKDQSTCLALEIPDGKSVSEVTMQVQATVGSSPSQDLFEPPCASLELDEFEPWTRQNEQ